MRSLPSSAGGRLAAWIGRHRGVAQLLQVRQRGAQRQRAEVRAGLVFFEVMGRIIGPRPLRASEQYQHPTNASVRQHPGATASA